MEPDRLTGAAIDTVPFVASQFGPLEVEALERVIGSGIFLDGPEVKLFETEFSHTLVRGWSTVSVASSSAAYALGLKALGIGPGDEVIVPSYAPVGPINSVQLSGARIVFADIDPKTLTIAADSVEAAISSKTKAILAVHLFGQPAHLDALSELALERGLSLIEDCSHAPGATIGGREIGTWGAFSVFSLVPPTDLSSGAGAMLVSSSREFIRRVRALRVRARDEFSPRMSEFTAAVGRARLVYLPGRTDRRRMNAAFFDQELSSIAHVRPSAFADPAWGEYPIRVPQGRDEVANLLRSDWGIETAVDIPVPCHLQPAFEDELYKVDLPNTERAAEQILGLPVHSELTFASLQRVSDAVNFLVG